MAYAVSVLVAGTSTALVMVNLGVDRWLVLASAAFVMSGTATLALIGVLDAGGSAVTAVAAALLVAARFGLLAIPLSHRFRGRPVWERAIASYPILDPGVAVAFREDNDVSARRSYLRMSNVSVTTWIVGMALGAVLGSLIPDPKTWGMDVAFPALLLATAGGIARKSRDMALTGVIGAGIAIVATPLVPAGLPVLLSILAASMGLGARRGLKGGDPA